MKKKEKAIKAMLRTSLSRMSMRSTMRKVSMRRTRQKWKRHRLRISLRLKIWRLGRMTRTMLRRKVFW